MDQKGAFNPSRCEIISAELIPFGKAAGDTKNPNISSIIGAFSISQSIGSSALSGSIDVFDGIGILENLPLRGEETLSLTIKAYDLQTEIELMCQIYKIDEVEITKDQFGLAYTLHWVTVTSYEASKRSFIKGYLNKTASTIVKDIFKTYYHNSIDLLPHTTNSGKKEDFPENTLKFDLGNDKGRKLYIEKTEDPMQLTIPDMTPAQAIQFVARRTFGKEPNAGSSFRFFETYKGYYFVSDEWLYDYGKRNGASIFHYGSFISLDPNDASEQITSLSHFGNPLRVDVGQEMNAGAYKSTVFEIDLLKRTAKRYNYDYKKFINKFADSTGNKADIKNDIHTENFIDSTFTDENARQYMIIRDYKDDNQSKGFRAETNFRDLAARRTFYKNHAAATSVIGVTEGRLDVQAGDIIRVNTYSKNISDNKKDNPQMSGRFLITGVDNTVEDGVLKTALSMFKYDWSDAGEDDGSRSSTKIEVAL
jgi:hypothetical protein